MARMLTVLVTVLLFLQTVCVFPFGAFGDSSSGRAANGPKIVDGESLLYHSVFANDTTATDPGHLFFIAGNELKWWDTAKNTSSVLMKVTYNLSGCPTCIEPSVLTKVGVSLLGNGSYHVAMLEMRPKNNATAQNLIGTVLGPDGSIIYSRHVDGYNVTKFQIARNLIAFGRMYNGTTNMSLEFMFWRDTYYYVSDDQQQQYGQGGIKDLAVSLSYSDDNGYIIHYATDTCHGVNTLITDNAQGFGGFGCYIKEIGSDWTIEKMDSYPYCNETACYYVNAMIERNLVDGHRKVDYWMMTHWDREVDVVVFEDTAEYQVLPDSPLEILWDGCFVELAFRVKHIAGVSPPPPPEVWVKRIGLWGEVQKGFSETITVGSISLVPKDGGFAMTGYSPGSWSGYPPIPHVVEYIYDTDIYGNWGVDGIDVFPLNGMMMEGEVMNVSFHPFSNIDVCGFDCMNASTAVLLVDDVPVQGQRMPLLPQAGFGWLNLTWTAAGGSHTLKVRMEVRDDVDFLDNEISISVQVDRYPDLELKEFAIQPSAVYPSQDANFQVRVLNNGGSLTKATVRIFLEGALVWNFTISNVVTGHDSVLKGRFGVTNTTVGPHNVKAEILAVDTNETNLKNNIAYSYVNVYLRELVLEITTPRDGQEATKSLSVEGKVTDLEGSEATVWAELWRNGLVLSSENVSTTGLFSFTLDLSHLQPALYTLVVNANGTEQRTATQRLEIRVHNEPYWHFLDPADGKLIVMDEGATTEITAIAKDGGTGRQIYVNWTVNGEAATNVTGFSFVGDKIRFGTSFNSAGTYIIEAKASNPFRNITALWRIVVIDMNRPPIIVGTDPASGKLKVQVNGTLNLTANGADPDGDNLSYVWTFDKETVHGQKITLRPGKAGNYTLVLKVSDGLEYQTVSWTVEVTKPPPVKVPKTKVSNEGLLTALVLVLVIALIAVIAVFYMVLQRLKQEKRRPTKKKQM